MEDACSAVSVTVTQTTGVPYRQAPNSGKDQQLLHNRTSKQAIGTWENLQVSLTNLQACRPTRLTPLHTHHVETSADEDMD